MYKMLSWSKHINLLIIRYPICNYSDQKYIDLIRMQHFLEGYLYYDLNIPVVNIILKGDYIGEYRDTKSTLQALRNTNYDKVIIDDVQQTLVTGFPKETTVESSY